MFPLKMLFLRSSISEVEGLISSRQNQTKEFIVDLDKRITDVRSQVFAISDHLSPRKADLEQEVRNLEREIRVHKVDCWRDVTNLLRDLRQLRKEYVAVLYVRGGIAQTP